jgi:muconolactone delta-isomerase
MQFLSISHLREGLTEADYAALVEGEIRQARLLYSEGFIRQIWHRTDIRGACLLWEAENEQRVQDMLGTFPFVQAGIVEISLVPLKPYGGFQA